MAEQEQRFAKEARYFLESAGYGKPHIINDYCVSAPATVGDWSRLRLTLAAFSGAPHTMQNACVAVVSTRNDHVRDTLAMLRYLSAPLALLRTDSEVQLWSVRSRPSDKPIAATGYEDWAASFSTRISELGPADIVAAKRGEQQLYFVDSDLFRWASQATEESLRVLLTDALSLGLGASSAKRSQASDNKITHVVFQLFASRVLQDKGVLELTDSPIAALKHARAAYPGCFTATIPHEMRLAAATSYEKIATAYDYQRVNSEMLGHVYEQTLVSSERQSEHGIYYTPQPIASYVLDSLPIESIPQAKRYVYDPCCGSGSFLLAAFNRLNAILPSEWSPSERHRYLQERLIGADVDEFAVGIARLSLVLADSTTRDGWQVYRRDALKGWDDLKPQPRIVVTNPPFREVKGGPRREMAADILFRIVKSLPLDSLIGIVLPTSMLESSSGTNARRAILESCNVIEIDLFPGGAFRSQAETSIWLLSKCDKSKRRSSVMIRELKGQESISKFMATREFSRTYPANQSAWNETDGNDFVFSPLSDVWDMLWENAIPLGKVARINTGLQIRKDDEDRVSKYKKPGLKPFVARLDVLKPFCFLSERDIRPYQWIDFDEDQLRRSGYVEMYENPKLLINSNRNPASAWRIVAAIAKKPVYFSDNFHGVQPKGSVPLEAIAAVMNSHVANGWLDAHSRKRKLVIATLNKIPFPKFSDADIKKLTTLVRALEGAIADGPDMSGDLFSKSGATEDAASLLSLIDTIVFKAYGILPDERSRIERFMNVDKRPRWET